MDHRVQATQNKASWYNLGMTTRSLKDVLERAASWPAEDQEALAEYAREIEARRTGVDVMSDGEREAAARGPAVADHGEFFADDAVAPAGGAMPEEPVRVSWEELRNAFDWTSFGEPYENDAVLGRRSGKFFLRSEMVDSDDEEEWPDDVDDDESYIRIPHRKELDLGKPLVFAFAEEFLPNHFHEVRGMFSRRGGYGRFKDLLQRKKALDQWYAFEAKATDEALREWCEENGIAIDEADAARKTG
jgi:hypothetical protein